MFPSERSAKPQATITLVPVCLTAAEMEERRELQDDDVRQQGGDAAGVGLTRYSRNHIVRSNNRQRRAS